VSAVREGLDSIRRIFAAPAVKTLQLRRHGMFSNINEVVQHLHLAEQSGYKLAIDWSDSAYRDPKRSGDPWNYYFKDCFSGIRPTMPPTFPSSDRSLVRRLDNIIAPRVEKDGVHFLLIPKDRFLPGRLIDRYIALHKPIARRVESFVRSNFEGFVVGLHLRGPRRRDRDILVRRAHFGSDGGVPFQLYFRFVDEELAQHPGARIFACSDSSLVIDRIVARYGSRVATYDAARSLLGEMHGDRLTRERFSPYRLGEDVLVEAYCLAQTSVFIHGTSNIANFILCKNPKIAHRYVCDDVDRRLGIG
jgi:hypothetical protein